MLGIVRIGCPISFGYNYSINMPTASMKYIMHKHSFMENLIITAPLDKYFNTLTCNFAEF